MNPVMLLVLICSLIVLGPLASIWSLNTLFPVLAIDYTPATWLAALLLNGTLLTLRGNKQG
jgi:hypothetical protein